MQTIVIPSTLKDLQALLDASTSINYGFYPELLETSTDDFYLDYTMYASREAFEQDTYRWAPEPLYLQPDINSIWKNPYLPVFIANTVLDALPKIKEEDRQWAAYIEGTALFYRAFSFFHLAQVFCDPYDIGGNNDGPGIPLRLNPDFSTLSVRATIAETYDRIIADLTEAASLLPDQVEYTTRPTKAAAHATLARVYLAMEVYEKAEKSAQEALARYDTLIDYNQIDPDARVPFQMMNEETIFFAYSNGTGMLDPRRALVDTLLYRSYQKHDLRKRAFFTEVREGEYAFKGAYIGFASSLFLVGPTTGELYLILAECRARAGNSDMALEALNTLLKMRWETDYFVPVSIDDSDLLLATVLEERRKELLFRGVRWSDLRRLNKDPRFAKTLTRVLDNGVSKETYSLPPGDLRYTFLIPPIVVQLTGIQQNPR